MLDVKDYILQFYILHSYRSELKIYNNIFTSKHKYLRINICSDNLYIMMAICICNLLSDFSKTINKY